MTPYTRTRDIRIIRQQPYACNTGVVIGRVLVRVQKMQEESTVIKSCLKGTYSDRDEKSEKKKRSA